MSEQTTPVASGAESADEEIVASNGTSQASPASIMELKKGMQLEGTVKSVTDFGAFVDLGIAQDGLVHISELARRRVQKVTDVVQVGDQVKVWVKKVDKQRGRISLTMVKPIARRLRDLKPDMKIEGVVTRIEPYGVFVDVGTVRDGLVHVSELADGYIKSPEEVVSVGDRVEAKVLRVDRRAGKLDLSMKEFISVQTPEPEPVQEEEEEKEGAAPTMMELAFQAALEGDNGRSKKKNDIDKLIAKSLKR